MGKSDENEFRRVPWLHGLGERASGFATRQMNS